MSSLLSGVTRVPEDAAFGIARLAKADRHPKAVMLCAGMYRDKDGRPWTLPAVAQAKEQLHHDTDLGHDYLDISGDPLFLRGARNLSLGPKYSEDLCIASVQTVAGTGANHVGAVLLADVVKPRQVWFSSPTWVNHAQIWEKADRRIQQRTYPYWRSSTKGFDFEGMMGCLGTESLPGDVVVLHACAHNPTGIDPSREQWQAIADLCRRRKLFPFFDSAYQGFASGDPEEDGWAVQHFLDQQDMEMGIAQSFSKNFGLYCERAGALHIKTNTREMAGSVRSLLCQTLRCEISTPPAFGARIVAKVLYDKELSRQWREDLRTMSSHIRSMREALYSELTRRETPGDWEHILNQIGMFLYIGITSEQAILLRDDHHIYLLDSGRVSMTGVTEHNVGYIGACLDAVVRKTTEPTDSQQAIAKHGVGSGRN